MIITKHEMATGRTASVSLQRDAGQPQRRQPALDRPDDRKTVFRKVQPRACGDRSDDHDERNREFRRKFLTEQDAGDHKELKGQADLD